MSIALYEFDDAYINPRGIPRVNFIEDIAHYITEKGITVESVLHEFRLLHSRYDLMESKLNQTRNTLSSKIPEIKKTLDTINFLIKQNEEKNTFTTYYGITDSAFAEAEVLPSEILNLWLGANVMVEFTCTEAHQLLTENLSSVQKNLNGTLEDLAWLKDQKVILQVNMSRVYNYDVINRRKDN